MAVAILNHYASPPSLSDPQGVKFRGGITRIPPAAEEFVGFKINSRVKCDCDPTTR